MSENSLNTCPACGSEMQEFRGKYFCLECGNEYEEKTNDLGAKEIVLTSGNPLRDSSLKRDAENFDVSASEEDFTATNESETDAEEVTEYAEDIEDDAEETSEKSPSIHSPSYFSEKVPKKRKKRLGLFLGILITILILFATAYIAGTIVSYIPDNDNNNIKITNENKSNEKDNKEQEEEKEEPTESPTPTVAPTTTPTVAPTATPTVAPQPTHESEQEEDTIYRVRTSSDDAKNQLGAFRNLESAKDLAKQNKGDGYKVYDQDGNLVYTP